MDTQTKENIVNDYKNGLKLVEIFEKYHTSYYTVSKLLDAQGIDHSRKKEKGKPNLKNMRILSQEEEDLVCKTYRETGRADLCCKAISGGQDVVRRCLQKYGLYRTASEAIRQSPQNQRKYLVNDNYFDIENERMAYLLGFLASDGTVRKNSNEIKLSLSSIDKDILLEFQKEVGGRPVKDYLTQEGFETSTWAFTSEHIKKKLAEYNIVPQKTFTFSFPKNLDKKYWRDFIRGYFDGDGSISSAGSSAIRFQICSVTKEVLETIVDFFEEKGISRACIMQTQRVHTLYYFQYSSVPTRQIYDILYYDNCWCLSRKREKYEQLLTRNLKI